MIRCVCESSTEVTYTLVAWPSQRCRWFIQDFLNVCIMVTGYCLVDAVEGFVIPCMWTIHELPTYLADLTCHQHHAKYHAPPSFHYHISSFSQVAILRTAMYFIYIHPHGEKAYATGQYSGLPCIVRYIWSSSVLQGVYLLSNVETEKRK